MDNSAIIREHLSVVLEYLDDSLRLLSLIEVTDVMDEEEAQSVIKAYARTMDKQLNGARDYIQAYLKVNDALDAIEKEQQ
jgi:hypothetical protein